MATLESDIHARAGTAITERTANLLFQSAFTEVKQDPSPDGKREPDLDYQFEESRLRRLLGQNLDSGVVDQIVGNLGPILMNSSNPNSTRWTPEARAAWGNILSQLGGGDGRSALDQLNVIINYVNRIVTGRAQDVTVNSADNNRDLWICLSNGRISVLNNQHLLEHNPPWAIPFRNSVGWQ